VEGKRSGYKVWYKDKERNHLEELGIDDIITLKTSYAVIR
jgi:hypothetical protein